MLSFIQENFDKFQRSRLKKVKANITEENKEINKLKIKDKEKIKKLEDLVKKAGEQIHTVVNIVNNNN